MAPLNQRRQHLVNWVALSAIASIGFFVWTEYRGFAHDHEAQSASLALMQQQLADLRAQQAVQDASDARRLDDLRAQQAVQDASDARRLDDLAHRLDLQRADIAAMQQAIAQHLDRK